MASVYKFSMLKTSLGLLLHHKP